MEGPLHAGSLLSAGLLQPLSENSRQGHQLSTVALYPGIGFINSNTATGLRVCLYDDGRRSRDTGKERDAESGLDYFGARYYGSALGRFTSPDPSPAGISMQDPQSWNLYSYVRNRPLAMVDGNGNWATPIHGDIVTYALEGYVSAGDLAVLRDRQSVMDSDQKDEHEYFHFMNQGSSASWQFVADMLSTASANTDANGKLSTFGLLCVGRCAAHCPGLHFAGAHG